jgi:hypothetical protein
LAKLVLLIVIVIGTAFYAVDRGLARLSRKLGFGSRRGLGPPWVRKTRRWLEQWPWILEVLAGAVFPILIWATTTLNPTVQSSVSMRPWILGLSAIMGWAGLVVVLEGRAFLPPEWRFATYLGGIAACLVLGSLTTLNNVDGASLLYIFAAFVFYRRATLAWRSTSRMDSIAKRRIQVGIGLALVGLLGLVWSWIGPLL